MKESNEPLKKVNNWIKSSVTLKLITITILMLLLLIPASMVESIIYERERLNDSTTSEVSANWAGSQSVNGPVLTIPLIYESMEGDKKRQETKYYHILPENLDIKGKIDPERLKRGIYEVVVYKSDLFISGKFKLSEKIDTAGLKEVRYGQSFITIGISDLRGIKDQIVLNWNGHKLNVKPGSRIPNVVQSGITIDLPPEWNGSDTSIPFDFTLNLQGSGNISFVPLGSTTNVKITSAWPSPGFNGNFLPENRNITSEGFEASWKVLQLNRNFPQSWMDSEQHKDLQSAAFGVDLILPLGEYQKSMRSAKYAAMTIALTFLMFFLVEVLNGRKIHPFQYALVGVSLCVFYILLVSLSEHVKFNTAYAIASFVIISMIGLYSITIFKARRYTFLLVGILVGIYGFLFVILQLSDYALLMGSIGLLVVIGLTMYFTRNINWYNLRIQED